MRNYKKFFLLCSVGLLALSVASCDKKEKRNTSVPLSDLDTSTVIASSKDHEVNNGLFYTRLRTKGYNTVLNEIRKSLFEEEYAFVTSQINLNDSTVNDYEQELFDSYANDIFGTSSISSIEDLSEKDRDIAIQKFIDSSMNKGITVTKENCLSYSFENEKIKFSYIPQDIINEKLITIALNKGTKDALEKIVDEEKIQDDDDKTVNNSNYISESNLSNYYDSHQKTYGTYRAIIIQFNNLNEARNVISTVEARMGRTLMDSDADSFALEFYVNLYNTYYNYRPALSISDPFGNSNDSSKTVFTVNKNKNELSEMSTGISGLVTETLEEDGQYIKQPFNQNSKYVMIYRGATEFELNKTYNITPYNEQIEWNDLKEHEVAYNDIRAEVRDELIDNKIASYTSTVIEKRVKNADIEIYDPYFENQFKSAYSDEYEYIAPNQFNNDLIFKLTTNSKTKEYSVNEFYTAQSKLSGIDIIVEQLKLDYVYDLKDKFLDSDQLNDLEDSLNNAITSFNKNENTAYPSAMGLETFLLANFGYTTKEDALKYNKIASSALTEYLNQKVFDEWAVKNSDGTYPDTHDIDYEKLNILDNLLAAGNANYSNLFSINIDHILIFIDDDGDGSPDDPEDFLKNFSDRQKQDFNDALLELANAIYEEANCDELTRSNSILEILQYIVGAYNRNERLFSDKTKTWEDYKKYNFLLTAESLSSNGDTTQSNVSTYVEEFGTYIKDLYKKAVENDLKIEDKKSKFYFIESLEKAPENIEDLCATQFGYHMIVVNSYSKPSTTKSTSSSDQYGYYKNIEILINELDKDTTDDNIYVIVPDAYNEEENKATMNQFFTYYVQKQTGVTSSLDSTLRDVLSSMFDSSITRYTSTGFQNYLLFKELNISVANSNSILAQQLANYEGYLKRTSQEYKTDDEFEEWYDGTLNWSRPYEK
ncbi:MAG: hypothetical protein K2N64_01490 [Anaeroplasmataceae bacterium]|nr:hypothetical protein [Anaeroplasmataceae bacterium]